MAVLLGAVADDFTGATDLCNTLVANGMRTVQLIGVPDAGTPIPEVDAIVVSLKSRTIPAADAVAQSLAALAWLRQTGARQFLFKYCSTFDSTGQGNIGPVAEAMAEALGTGFTIACPAFPTTGRTIYLGHLFVGDVLLSDSGMRHHPLTPMTDASLVRVLQRQSSGSVGLVPFPVVERGAPAIAEAFAALQAEGRRHAIVDAVTDAHLMAIGEACATLPLITGGSGITMGLPANFRRQGLLPENREAATLPAPGGHAAIIAGSCSTATLGQIAWFRERRPALAIDPLALAAGGDEAARALEWAIPHLADGPVLVYASAPPEQVAAIQERLGRERAGALVEDALARVTTGLLAAGVRRLVLAGGETSGAAVSALGVQGLRIGPQIDPGVPWTQALGRSHDDGSPLFLALKSGNFGSEGFFLKAFETLR